MDYITHKKIHKFDFDGVINDDKDLMRLRQQYHEIAEEYMRNKGYIPHFDLDPIFTIEYTTKGYLFKYTRYGVYVGKVKAKCYLAVSGTKLIPMTDTQKVKLKKSSPNVA